MSVQTLVEYFVAPTTLNEGAIERWFTGKDAETLEDFEKTIKLGFSNQAEKNKVIEDIDDAIDNANRIITHSSFTHWLTGVTIGMGIIGLLRVIIRASNGDDRKVVLDALHDIRSRVQAAKINKNQK